jgi:hypothetical protein
LQTVSLGYKRKSTEAFDPLDTSATQVAKRYPPYLLARQIAALKRISDDTETPVQFLIRQAIDEFLRRRKKKRASATD